MSIASDVRSYADAALEQGKHVVDQAQARLTEVAGDVGATEAAEKVQDRAQEFASRATATYVDLARKGESFYERVSAMPIVETVTSTVEPYVKQFDGYRIAFTEKVEEFYAELKKNEQVAKVLDGAESAAGVVVGTVNEHVVKPVRSLVEHAPIVQTARPAPRKAAPAKSTAPRKTAARKTAPAKRTAPRKTTTLPQG